MAFSRMFPGPFRPAFDAGLAAAGNGLLNNLVAYWPLNEAAGANNALDAHTNGLTLTQAASPGSAAGVAYAGARSFANTNQRFTRASQALLQIGDADFAIALWFYLPSKTTEQGICGKYTTTGNQREHLLEYNLVPDRFQFLVSGDGTALTQIRADTFGSPPSPAWYFIVTQHDSVGNTIGISVNGGALDTTAHSAGVFSGSSVWQLSGINNANNVISIAANGRIGPVAFWKNRTLDAAARAALYNAGAGLAYSAFTT